MTIEHARAEHQAAMDAAAEAALAVNRAHVVLYRELRAAFDARLAAHGGASVSSEQLAELGFPCEDCLQVVRPFDHHEIHFGNGEMTARCGRRL